MPSEQTLGILTQHSKHRRPTIVPFLPLADCSYAYPMISAQETLADVKTSALLSSLWLRIRPIIDERLEVIERAAAAASSGTLDVDTREEAADVAHKLAGSLGMYGYDSGTRLARQLELLLDYSNPDPAQLKQLSMALRQSLTFTGSE